MSRPSRSALLVVTAVVGGLLAAVTTASPAAVAAVPATPPGAFVGLTPARVLDTRTGTGAPKAPVAPGRPLHLTVAGHGGVPADAAAVVLTLTVAAPTTAGYLTAYPTGAAVPATSVANWVTGQTVAGSATVTLGTAGSIDLRTTAARPVDLVADVAGYFVAGSAAADGAYAASRPTRLLDTRTGNGGTRGPLASGHTLHVTLAGRGPVPFGGASAVVATLTVTHPRSPGYVTAWPSGRARPTASALNFTTGQTVANQVTVPLGTDGGIDLYAGGGPLDVVADVTGYILAGDATAPGTYVPLTPARVYDTRTGGTVPTPGADATAAVAGRGGVPRTGVGAVVVNLTVTTTRSAGYLTVWPSDEPRPLASNVNWATGRTVANQASLVLGQSGVVGLHLAGATRADVVIDVSGYYLPVRTA